MTSLKPFEYRFRLIKLPIVENKSPRFFYHGDYRIPVQPRFDMEFTGQPYILKEDDEDDIAVGTYYNLIDVPQVCMVEEYLEDGCLLSSIPEPIILTIEQIIVLTNGVYNHPDLDSLFQIYYDSESQYGYHRDMLEYEKIEGVFYDGVVHFSDEMLDDII